MHYDTCGDHLNLSVNDFYAKCMKCCARRLRTAASEVVSGVGRGHAHGACRAGSAGAGVAGRESVGAAPPVGALRGGCAFRRDLWGYACAMVGGGQWLESVRYGFLKKQGGTWEEKVGTWVEKGAGFLRLWRAAWVIRLQAGVMGVEAVLAESSAMFTDRGAS